MDEVFLGRKPDLSLWTAGLNLSDDRRPDVKSSSSQPPQGTGPHPLS